MKVRKEIELYAEEQDKPILLWLLNRYSKESKWSFVANGKFSYQVHRIWKPTKEGVVLYKAKEELE